MKTKNLKKALSLFLAVLMIALAIPFTFLTASAEEATSQKVKINKLSAFGQYADGNDVAFYGSYPAGNAFDGDIVINATTGLESDAQIQAKNKGYKYNYCYLDANGKMQHGANNGDDYFLFFIIELADNAVVVDSLNLWTPKSYYGDGWWMCNDGYEIFYSKDGSTYTDADIKDAKFNKVYTGENYKNLYQFETFVNANGEDQEGYVHKINMNGVTAKYIAIGVSGLASGAEALLTEVEVMGSTPATSYEIEINSLTPFGNWVDKYEPICFNDKKEWTEDKAHDGDITSDAQTYEGADRKDFVMTHFDANGVMKQGRVDIGTSYFGIFVVELDDYAKIDTLSLWTPYVNDSKPANRPYMANNGYDIYYSVDGESYTAVDGASFKDVYEKQSTADALYVEGTYNGTDGHVHEIDMGGVKAKYIAIAVSDLAYGTFEIIFSEIVVEGAYTSAPKGNIKDFYRYSHILDGNQTVVWDQNYPKYKAIDGSIAAGDETRAYTEGSLTPSHFTDLMPNTINENAGEKEYYALFEIVLNEETEVSSLSIWTPYYGDKKMSNDGYDIYYSADGVNYYAVKDATFENVYGDKDNNGYYVESMYGTDKGHVHDIDMRDVKAKWVVIAVSAPVYDKEDTYMIFSELVVHGTPTVKVTDFDVFGNHKVDASTQKKVGFYDLYRATNAFDGKINTDAQICNNDSVGNLTYEMCYFDADGIMRNGEKAGYKSYYVMFVIKLSACAEIDSLSLWTTYLNPETKDADKPYMANNGYDIYYSVDGKSYSAVEGAEFNDVYSDRDNKGYYVEGTYNGTKGHVHEIDMNVTAKYIAIAVSALVYGADEALVSEVVVTGTSSKRMLQEGASVRMSDPTGIRFTGTVDRSYYDRLVKDYGKDNVKMGILITPTEYLDNVDEFTKEALDAWNVEKTKYLEIDANAILTDGNATYRINCAMVNIKTENVLREFSARLYVKITNDGKTEYLYSGFSKTSNSRSIAYVASAALSDVRDEADSSYKYPVTVNGETKYSPYDADNRTILESFSSKASTITVMTYNIKSENQGQTTENAYDTIVKINPDVVCLQEDAATNINAIKAKDSDYTALNRSWNGKEYNAILYNSKKLTAVKNGIVEYKDIMDEYSDNSAVTAANFALDTQNRFFRWAILEDSKGVQYLVVNTHLHFRQGASKPQDDDENSPGNTAVRVAQIILLKLWLSEQSVENQIVVGDMNCHIASYVYKNFASGECVLDSARDDAIFKGDVGGTDTKDYVKRNEWIWDHIFYVNDTLGALEYSVIDNAYDCTPPYPSDHLPVYAKIIAK